MIKLHLEDSGPGSFNEIQEYVEAVLEENFVPAPGNTRPRPFYSSSRAITISICNRLDIEWT